MGLTFQCPACGGHHHAYTMHFSMGRICVRCARAIRQGEPLELAIRVRRALARLEWLDAAYRILALGGSADVRRLALRAKTRALIQHDRILRALP